MRKALCIGIENYAPGNQLAGCVNDACSIGKALETHHDGKPNFEVQYLKAARWESKPITAAQIREAINKLFGEDEPEIALFFYSGHGAFDGKRGYLCPSDCKDIHAGVPMDDLIDAARESKAKNKIIVLDCCHSGATGVDRFAEGISLVPDDTIIMAGCTMEGFSQEKNGSGVYTQLFLEALNGADANVLGVVTPGSIYAYIDKALGSYSWQRPVFKSNVKNFICLKKNKPPIEIEKLLRLPLYFANPEFEFPLDPSYEEDKNYVPAGQNTDKDEEHEAVFRILRKYWQYGLVVPIGLPEDKNYMYWAAVYSTGCKLTALGKYYWKMIHNGTIDRNIINNI